MPRYPQPRKTWKYSKDFKVNPRGDDRIILQKYHMKIYFNCSNCGASYSAELHQVGCKGSTKSAAESWKSRNYKTVQYYLNILVQLRAAAHRKTLAHLVFITSFLNQYPKQHDKK